MEKIQKENQKWFREILNLFCSDPHISYDAPEYERLYKNSNRIIKKMNMFLSDRNDIESKSMVVFKHFIVAIYILCEKKINGMRLSQSLTPSCFIKHCLHHSSMQSNEGKTYDTSVSNEELTFFLAFFKLDSYVAQKLPTPVPTKKQAELEQLIKNEDADSQKRFMEFVNLIFSNN